MENFKDYLFGQNQWWLDYNKIDQDQHLLDLSQEKFIWKNEKFLNFQFKEGIYIVTGMRQIGKTTHLKMLIKKRINKENKNNFFYFNSDILENKKQIVDLAEYYLKNVANRKKKVYLIFDEITAIKDGILAIKYLIDSGQKRNIVYILSGSSSVNFRKTGEFLPGRRGYGQNFIFNPLTLKDIIKLKYPSEFEFISNALKKQKKLEIAYQIITQRINLKKELDKYLISGGIPKIINTIEKNKKIPSKQFQSYLSWIKSEVAKNDKDEYYTRVILERIYQSLSSDLSYNSISQDAGIGSHNTIYNYLNFLEYSFIIHQLYNFDFRQNKVQKKKNKKIYFNDPFIYWLVSFWSNFGADTELNMIKSDIIKSRLIENAVAILLWQKFGQKLFFHRSDYEIDFIVNKEAFEVKYQNKISKDDLKNILKYPDKKIVISKNAWLDTPQLKIIPADFFLLAFGKF